jgi:hypothetical protein
LNYSLVFLCSDHQQYSQICSAERDTYTTLATSVFLWSFCIEEFEHRCLFIFFCANIHSIGIYIFLFTIRYLPNMSLRVYHDNCMVIQTSSEPDPVGSQLTSAEFSQFLLITEISVHSSHHHKVK